MYHYSSDLWHRSRHLHRHHLKGIELNVSSLMQQIASLLFETGLIQQKNRDLFDMEGDTSMINRPNDTNNQRYLHIPTSTTFIYVFTLFLVINQRDLRKFFMLQVLLLINSSMIVLSFGLATTLASSFTEETLIVKMCIWYAQQNTHLAQQNWYSLYYY